MTVAVSNGVTDSHALLPFCRGSGFVVYNEAH